MPDLATSEATSVPDPRWDAATGLRAKARPKQKKGRPATDAMHDGDVDYFFRRLHAATAVEAAAAGGALGTQSDASAQNSWPSWFPKDMVKSDQHSKPATRRDAARSIAASSQTLMKQQEARMKNTAALLDQADDQLHVRRQYGNNSSHSLYCPPLFVLTVRMLL